MRFVRFDARFASEEPDDDRCRVCGRRTKLTFEHVPPASTGNSTAAEMLGLEHWLNRDAIAGTPTSRGTILQRGTGVQTLCAACNSRAGRLYVPDLVKWISAGEAMLRSLPLAELDSTTEARFAHVKLERIRPARFLKQLVTMLLAIAAPGFALHRDNLDLSAFAQDPEWVGLPDRYQFYLALYTGPIARFNGGTGVLRLGDDDRAAASDFVLEIAHPPFAYMLSIDQTAPMLDCGNISNFADLTIGQTCDLEIDLRVGFGHTPLPYDLRSKAALLADRAENRRQAALEHLWVPQNAR